MTTREFLECLRPELADITAYAPSLPPGVKVRLDANEAPPLTHGAVRDAVASAVAKVALERYPDPRALELKEAIALRTGAPAASLVVGTGSDEVISLLATACARPRGRNPQATIAAPTPTFVMYRITARAHGLRFVEIPLDATWDLDVSGMKKAIDVLTPNIVFIASPNNPTGNRMTRERIEAVIAAAPNALVVVDEAYVDYTKDGTLRALREHANVAMLHTISKLGLAALRIGWIEADEAIVSALDKARQPFNVSATSQAAAAAVLRDAWPAVREHVASVVAERERVAGELGRLQGLTPLPTEANFVWVHTERPAGDVHAGLIARGVLVRSFHHVGGRLAQHLRITIGTRAENDALLEAIAKCD
jgi:histidinol-phosphate aminotransferase